MTTHDDSPSARVTLGPVERRLLLAALDVRATLDDVDVVGIDWHAVTQVALRAHILPLLADRVLPNPAWRIDEPSRALLLHALKETSVYNSRVLAELGRAASILRAAHVDFVALKGAVLLAEHYPRITLRHTVDLDLLIDPQRYDVAILALRAAGYDDDPHYTTTLVGDGSSMAQAWPARAHACPPLKGPSGVTVDPHHRVPTSDFDETGGFAGWLGRSHARVVHGELVQMCDRTDLAAHLCEHFALQHHADPLDAPKLLCDLRALVPVALPWPQLQTGSPARRVSVLLARALYEAAFENQAARDPLTRLLRRVAVADPSVSPWLGELSHLRGHASRLAFNVRTRPRYALRTLFPTRAYMAQQHHVDERSPWIYPLYAKRLLTTLWRIR